MKREHLMAAVGGTLVVLAVLVVFSRGPDEPVVGEDPPIPPVREKPPRPSPRPGVGREVGKRVDPEDFLKDLGEQGFAATEDRGRLEITAPGEVGLSGDALVTAPGGDGFHLQGAPEMRAANTIYRTTDGDGYLHIKADGSIKFSPGNWKSERDQ